MRRDPATTEQQSAEPVIDGGGPDEVRSVPGLISAVVGILLTGALLAGSIFFSLPSNVLSTRDGGDLRAFSARFLPQSWAFFTKPPSDPEFVPYLVNDDGVAYAARLPNSRPDNLYGLSRRQRAQGPEVAAMANQVKEWKNCEEAEGDCPAVVAGSSASRSSASGASAAGAGPVAESVENTSPVPTLCGRLVLVETRPVPWKFRDKYEGWRLDKRAALVEAKCSRGE